MSRILKGYQTRFRELLQKTHAQRIEQGVQWLVGKAQARSERDRIPLAEALNELCDKLESKPWFERNSAHARPARFQCDAGLGGVARWLRAAGYEAFWQPDIDDPDLLKKARLGSATILTTDSMLMERRLIRDNIIPAFWLPPALGIHEQMKRIFRQFQLQLGEPRCMQCGGELRREAKEALRDRIPPKTYRWLDDYFVCCRCGKLFWRGTHWERISRELRTLSEPI